MRPTEDPRPPPLRRQRQGRLTKRTAQNYEAHLKLNHLQKVIIRSEKSIIVSEDQLIEMYRG